ncbi:MAG: DUF6146 family protein [Cyclobacteriaceae bacterium]
MYVILEEADMKKVAILLIPLFILGCAQNIMPPRSVSSNIIQETDDEQHEIVILDPEFQSWFVTHAKPIGFYSLRFYESHNIRYVTAWNQKARNTYGPITNEINYDPNEDYGMEVNYKLYWYFKYIESIYGRYFFL